MQGAEHDLVDYLAKGVAALIAWFLVVLGWAVVNDLTVQRERRKSDEGKIDLLRKSLDEIEELAVQHHSQEFDEVRARKIAKRVKSIGLECSHLERCNVISSDWRSASIAVKRAITMQNFEKAGHKVKAPSDEIVLVIEEAFGRFQTFLMRTLEQKVGEAEPLRSTLWRILKRI